MASWLSSLQRRPLLTTAAATLQSGTPRCVAVIAPGGQPAGAGLLAAALLTRWRDVHKRDARCVWQRSGRPPRPINGILLNTAPACGEERGHHATLRLEVEPAKRLPPAKGKAITAGCATRCVPELLASCKLISLHSLGVPGRRRPRSPTARALACPPHAIEHPHARRRGCPSGGVARRVHVDPIVGRAGHVFRPHPRQRQRRLGHHPCDLGAREVRLCVVVPEGCGVGDALRRQVLRQLPPAARVTVGRCGWVSGVLGASRTRAGGIIWQRCQLNAWRGWLGKYQDIQPLGF